MSMLVPNVKFAPLKVPFERRLQTLAATAWIVICLFGSPASYLLITYLIFYTQTLRYLALLYLLWIYLHRDECETGGRGDKWTNWLRKSAWWKYYCDYFPITLVKTVDLDPTQKYLFCSFPHGVLSTGTFGSITTDARDFSKLFPGIQPRVLTLGQHFNTPIFREFCYSLGSCSASAKSLHYLLSQDPPKPYTGRATVLMIGGASESLESVPGIYRIILKRRKGFIRIALQHGTPLVPVFSFGETDLYNQPMIDQDSLLRRFQHIIRKTTGIAPVLLLGRGIFQYSFGIVPHRKPVSVVVGSPLQLPLIKDPTPDEIEKYHSQFTDHLIEFFEANKGKYLSNPENVKLELVA